MSMMLTKYTGKKQKREWRWVFLNILASSGNVTLAALGAGKDRRTVYRHRDLYPNFAKRWDEAIEVACDFLEAEARKRALASSDQLMVFLLKAHRPHVYRDNYAGKAQIAQPQGNVEMATDTCSQAETELTEFRQQMRDRLSSMRNAQQTSPTSHTPTDRSTSRNGHS